MYRARNKPEVFLKVKPEPEPDPKSPARKDNSGLQQCIIVYFFKVAAQVPATPLSILFNYGTLLNMEYILIVQKLQK